MDQIQERAAMLLAAAQNSEADTAVLFTRFGCHAFAFAAVQRFGGAAVLMTEMMDPKWGPTQCVHAWCETDAMAVDYLGRAPSSAAVFERFLSQPGFSPPWHPNMSPSKIESLDRAQIDQVLAGSRPLPKGFYGEPVWLRRAISFADLLIAHRCSKLGGAL